MRALLSSTAIALVLSAVSPAAAQMCAPGGMCGGMTGQAQPHSSPAQSTMPEHNASPGQSAPQGQGGCACCRNMAMMHPPGQPGMMPKPQ